MHRIDRFSLLDVGAKIVTVYPNFHASPGSGVFARRCTSCVRIGQEFDLNPKQVTAT
jgi:hypothetical protein